MYTLSNTQIQHVVLAPVSLMFKYEIVLFHLAEASSPHLRLISIIYWLSNSYLISS